VETDGGAAAIELLASGEGIDVVLLDMTMPDMSGADVWRQLCERGVTVPVVVMSGFAEEEMLRRFGDGLSGLVRKPFTAQQLTGAIDEALFAPNSGGPYPPVHAAERTVLVVDDDEGVRRTCSRILRSAGYSVRTACDGAEALSLYDAGTDLVLLDLVMPVMDGTETFERLLALDAGVRVLFFCGARVEQLRGDLVSAGARGVVGKPVSSEGLLEGVDRALA
jgi:CheY-like chemotaxis protein